MQALGYTVLLLGILIFVHELGHFLVAKACKVKVTRFSIGFGPRLFGFTRGETEYRIAILPLGGYVKMAGDSPYDELPPDEAHRGFLAQPPWKRALIVAAGPVFNLVFPILVFFAMFVGPQQEVSNRIADVSPGLPASRAGLQPGDRVLAIQGEPVRSFREIQALLAGRADQDVTLLFERDGETKSARMTPEKFTGSGLLAAAPRGLIGISPVARVPTIAVPAGSPADAAGLKTFDRVLSVNDQSIKSELDLTQKLRGMTGELEVKALRPKALAIPGTHAREHEVVTVKLQRQEGEGFAALGGEAADRYVAEVLPGSAAAEAGLKPGDELLELDGKPIDSFLMLTIALNQRGGEPFALTWQSGAERVTRNLAQRSIQTRDELKAEVTQFELGLRNYVENANEPDDVEMVTIHYGVGAALERSLRVVPQKIKETATILGALVIGRVPMDQLGGPLMLHQLASKTTEYGIDYFLQLLALISVNLGLVNLAPIPILDGFHLLAALWEGVRRRPIPVRAREVANMVGLVLLVMLMVRVFYNDLTR